MPPTAIQRKADDRLRGVLYLATGLGLVAAEHRGGRWRPVTGPATGNPLTSVSVLGDAVFAGGRGGIWRSGDGGRTADQVLSTGPDRRIRWMSSFPGAGLLLAGVQPASIWLSHDGGRRWVENPQVSRMGDRFGWFLPYAPEAGCVRGFAGGPGGPSGWRLYAAVEVGGLLTSEDGGRNWHLVGGSDGSPELDRELGGLVHPDVHDVAVHPADTDRLAAPTGGGLFQTTDAGRHWSRCHPGYTRAVWMDPEDPDRMVAGPAEGVAKNGRIEFSDDGGGSWQPWSDGADTPWPRHMVERFAAAGDALLAVLSNGNLLSAPVSGGPWQRILPEVPDIKAVVAA